MRLFATSRLPRFRGPEGKLACVCVCTHPPTNMISHCTHAARKVDTLNNALLRKLSMNQPRDPAESQYAVKENPMECRAVPSYFSCLFRPPALPFHTFQRSSLLRLAADDAILFPRGKSFERTESASRAITKQGALSLSLSLSPIPLQNSNRAGPCRFFAGCKCERYPRYLTYLLVSPLILPTMIALQYHGYTPLIVFPPFTSLLLGPNDFILYAFDVVFEYV